MKMESLEDLFVDQLRDIYNAENQLVKALPKMAKAASAPELQRGFQEHLEQTKGHIHRLERIFDQLGQKPGRKKCEAMEDLVEEGHQLIEEDAEPEVKDAGLIAAAQKVEHYEIAGYGTLRTWAQHLGYDEAAHLLQQTLGEEDATDKKLTQLAESFINVGATARAH